MHGFALIGIGIKETEKTDAIHVAMQVYELYKQFLKTHKIRNT